MLIDVVPIKEESLDCLQCIIVSVLKYLYIEYELMFAGSWGFSFKEKTEKDNPTVIGELIKPGWNLEVWDYLERYHGMKIEWHNHVLNSELNFIIKDHIEKADPVVLAIDGFHCPWDTAYLKYHNLHYCLTVGIDDADESFLCIDPYDTPDIIKLQDETLKNGFMYLMTFNPVKDLRTNINWKQILNEALNNLGINDCDKNAFTAMRKLAAKIEQSLDIKAELTGFTDIHVIPILGQLKIIDSARVNFSKTLKYIAQKYSVDELLTISDGLIKAGIMWSKIRLKLIKISMMPDPNLEIRGISGRINQIADYEEKLANDILILCND